MLQPNSGFTLIEVLLAALILSIIGTLTFSSLFATFRTQKTIEDRTEIQEIGTAAITRIQEDLIQTFHVEAPHPLTIFKGENNGDRDRLEFTSLCHSLSTMDAKESDQTLISYMTESEPGGGQLYVLKRRETRFLSAEPDKVGDFVTLATNVVSFNLEYSDGQSFKSGWDIRSTEQLNKLPRMVKATLRLRDQRGREETFEMITDIPMSESLGNTGNLPAGQGGVPGQLPGGQIPGQAGGQPGQPGFQQPGQPGGQQQPRRPGQPIGQPFQQGFNR